MESVRAFFYFDFETVDFDGFDHEIYSNGRTLTRRKNSL